MISTDQANFNGDFASVFTKGKKGEYRKRAVKVGSFPANKWGLYDMHGNVQQWCEDLYDSDYYKNSPPTDPLNDKKGTSRVIRGGGWGGIAGSCRSADRRGMSEFADRDFYVGFRVARSSVE
jgi:formylglycine-generating enzyme required for sulfatase activity